MHDDMNGRPTNWGAPPKPEPGSAIGKYRLIEPLGSGAMGQVWKADEEGGLRTVALKILPAFLLNDQAAWEQMRSAYQAVHDLHHAALCPLYDLGRDERFG